MKKEFWDFDENINYTTVNIQGKNYKVINKFPDYYSAALILNHIHSIIIDISIYLKINYYKFLHIHLIFLVLIHLQVIHVIVEQLFFFQLLKKHPLL